tara:strand:+ start:405 stop:701 length:297 start_codon:yes stop_codon:yes gene_type:complete
MEYWNEPALPDADGIMYPSESPLHDNAKLGLGADTDPLVDIGVMVSIEKVSGEGDVRQELKSETCKVYSPAHRFSIVSIEEVTGILFTIIWPVIPLAA